MLVTLVTFGCCGCGFLLYEANDGRLKGNWEGTLNPAVFVDSSGNKSKGYLLEVKRAPEGESLVKWGVLQLGTEQLALAEWPAKKTKDDINRFVIYTEENFAPGTRVRVRGEALSSTLLSKTGENLSSKDKPFYVLRVLKIEKIKLYSPKLDSRDEPAELQFNLPNDFKGVFKVITDASGLELGDSGVLNIDVPKNGHVKLKNLKAFRKEHRLNAFYENNEEIPLIITEKGKGFFEVFSTSKDEIWFFVGTRDECTSLLNKHPKGLEGILLNQNEN
ncbi:uncharacterized protein METZ01_LOCUS245596 [marine metagenome]|uniref:Uncharacterized protein n=1 Tax=marine metagenome TaxID=408172 RepID=A0A382I087_9ZZZZ